MDQLGAGVCVSKCVHVSQATPDLLLSSVNPRCHCHLVVSSAQRNAIIACARRVLDVFSTQLALRLCAADRIESRALLGSTRTYGLREELNCDRLRALGCFLTWVLVRGVELVERAGVCPVADGMQLVGTPDDRVPPELLVPNGGGGQVVEENVPGLHKQNGRARDVVQHLRDNNVTLSTTTPSET
eukprot:1103343-Pyramimonas_sp.AAC.1